MTFGSLFAGIGGFDLGFERAGMRCLWQVEIDDYCQLVLAKHWPNVPRWGDIRTFPCEQFEVPDVICGGFPCKQTSTAAAIQGRRKGLQGEDSGLWYEMLRVLRELRPGIVVVENVAGAKTYSSEITRCLEELGYTVGELRVSASELGAFHERRRLFFVADLDSERFQVAWQGRSLAVTGDERRAITGDFWDADSSRFCGMAHGLSCRLDRRKRIERLGNAVVPQVAEWIGRKLLQIEEA